MAETKHTPGPWEIEFSRTGVEWPTIIAPREPHYDDGSAYIICEIGESYPIGKETPQKELALANAALIAAAPETARQRDELLEALKAFVDAFGKRKPERMYTRNGTYSVPDVLTISPKIVEKARAAIASATPSPK